MTKSEIFKKAHLAAKEMVGHYAARFALALKSVYKESKKMIGTEKQIQLALDIKKEMLTNIENFLNDYEEIDPELIGIMGFMCLEQKEKDLNYFAFVELRNYVESKNEAVWFINNRHQPLTVMAQQLFKKLEKI